MRLLELLRATDRRRIYRFLQFSGLAGAASTYCFFLVVKAAEDPTTLVEQESGFWSVLQFLLALFVFCIAQLRALTESAPIIEQAVHDLRCSLLRGLQAMELRDAEVLGTSRIQSALAADAQAISQAAGPMAFGVQSLMMVVFAVLYLAYISPSALLLTAIVASIAGWAYVAHSNVVGRALDSARRRVAELQSQVASLVNGFKELKLSVPKADSARRSAEESSTEAAVDKLVAHQALARDYVLSNLAFFFLLGTVVFLMPWIRTEYSESVSRSLAAVMFLIGPLLGVIGALPQVAVANVAATSMLDLEQEILSKTQTMDEQVDESMEGFGAIELHQVRFEYGGRNGGFSVGPLSLSLRRGEVLFITGDNGSGKSTLLKLLAGLYKPTSGDVLVDGRHVWPHRTRALRGLMSSVFADFCLFDRLHGIEKVDPHWCEAWLQRLQLQDKVKLVGGRFSTTSLSTGQRKRLALFAALAEQRPILILDEWAADQDPSFRRHFYLELLPLIRAEGRTVVAITHDEAYFDYADRRIHIADGQIES